MCRLHLVYLALLFGPAILQGCGGADRRHEPLIDDPSTTEPTTAFQTGETVPCPTEAASATNCPTNAADVDFKLSVLHINDVHARVETDSSVYGKDPFGGYARAAAYVKKRKAELEACGQSVLFLDAGDSFTGQAWVAKFQGQLLIQLLNAMNFDAYTMGNHEYYQGPAKIKDLFMDKATFPVLSNNLEVGDASTADALYPTISDSVKKPLVKTVCGKKIGIIGITTPAAEGASGFAGMSMADPETTLKVKVKELQGENVDIIIALTHVGYDLDTDLCAKVPEVDLWVGGHTHTFLGEEDGYLAKKQGAYPTLCATGGAPVVTAYAYTGYVGELNLGFKGNELQASSGEATFLAETIAQDADVAALVDAKRAEYEAWATEVVGTTPTGINGERDGEFGCRNNTCEYGVLLCEEMLRYGQSKGYGTQIAMYNGGGIRASLQPGNIDVEMVKQVHPFGNSLSYFTLPGSAVRGMVTTALEKHGGPSSGKSGSFMQMAGMRWHATWDASAAAWTIQAIHVKSGDSWVDLDDSATYNTCNNVYIFEGGDGMADHTSQGTAQVKYEKMTFDVMLDYFTANTPVSAPTLDGRHCMKDTTAECGGVWA